MKATTESPGRGKRAVPARPWSTAWLLVLATGATGVMMLAAAGPALASYSGRAGEISCRNDSSYFDVHNNAANGGSFDLHASSASRPARTWSNTRAS